MKRNPQHEFDALQLVIEARLSQIVAPGHSVAHESSMENGELAVAAACYAKNTLHSTNVQVGTAQPLQWPFAADEWKPSPDNRLSELARAGAYILAEIERLLLEQSKTNG